MQRRGLEAYWSDFKVKEVNKRPNKKIKRNNVETLHINHSPDFLLIICVLSFVLLGLIMVYSASWPESLKETNSHSTFFISQFRAMLIGLILMVLTYIIPVRFYKKLWPLIFISAIILNILPLTPFGIQKYGARRWLSIAGFVFMPSDIMKIAGVIAISGFMVQFKDIIKTWKGALAIFIIIGAAIFFVLKQKDLGTSAVILAVMGALAFLGGINFPAFATVGLAGIFGGYKFLIASDKYLYRQNRIDIFLDPFQDSLGTGMQAVRSLYALGSGGLSGQSLGRSVQKYFYLPFSFNDFIFSVMGEELGFIGTFLYLVVLAIFVFKGMWTAVNVRDKFSKYLAMGIVLTIAIQSIVHVLVALSALPTKGIGLPFISQGGTSLVLFMGMAGILFQISKHTDLRKKSKE